MGEQTDDQNRVGQSESRSREEAHKGDSSALVTEVNAGNQNDMKKPRKPGKTDENRTLGTLDLCTDFLIETFALQKHANIYSNDLLTNECQIAHNRQC